MLRQARLNTSRFAPVQRAAIRRYAIDTKGSGIPPVVPSPLGSGARPVPNVVVSAGPAVQVKPVVVVPGASTIDSAVLPNPTVVEPSGPRSPPPPPPPTPKAPSKFGRRLLLFLTLGTLIFYPTSALVSLRSAAYRDFFTSAFPYAESLVDYADDNDWDRLDAGKVAGAVKGAGDRAKGMVTGATPDSAELKQKLDAKAQQAKDTVKKSYNVAESSVQRTVNAASRKAEEAKAATKSTLSSAEAKAKSALASAESKANSTLSAAERKAEEVKAEASKRLSTAESTAKDLVNKAAVTAGTAVQAVKSNAAEASETLKTKAHDLVATLPDVDTAKIKFSEGVDHLVAEAEAALSKAERKGEEEIDKFTQAIKPKGEEKAPLNVQAQLPDTQPARGIKPVSRPKVDEISDKKQYTGPPLPLGFEPPPGYYIARPAATADQKAPAKPTTEIPVAARPVLPLLAPKVKEFTSSADEPIISQLASTIDSLASSLNPASSSGHLAAPETILSKAQDDLSALSSRLEALKAEERTKLETSAKEKAKEFEGVLAAKEQEWKGKEGKLVEGWKEEREKLIDGWRKVLDRELEGQRVGIEQRLREEVIAQGIELQRRWLRSIKAQVESERGGRLAKLDNLTTSFKQLERITLDNSSQLDAHAQLHTLWSALRAVQAKTDRGNVAFDDELRVLKSAAQAASSTEDENTKKVISAMIASIDGSGAATQGVKSFPSLASWFSSTLVPKIRAVSLVPAEHEAGVLSLIASAGLSKILFTRKAGWVEGDDVGSIVARAEYLVGQKDLDGAAREVNQLKGWPAKLASDWLREARQRLAVEQALGVIANEATLSSLLLANAD